MLGKLAARLAPPEPQLQHAALRLSARGWETLPLPAPDGSGVIVVALDLHSHQAIVEHSAGRRLYVPLTPHRFVGQVTRDVLAAVGDVAGPVPFDPTPQETSWSVPLGYGSARLDPAAAHWEQSLGEFVLDWDDVIRAEDPHGLAMTFARSAVSHSCSACDWDPELSASLEGRPPPVS